MKLALLCLSAIGLIACNRRGEDYAGYFKSGSIAPLVRSIDASVVFQGSGGGGSSGTSFPSVHRYTHTLKGDGPIKEDYLNRIHDRVLADMKANGIKVITEKDANGSDDNYPTAGVRLITWGFQILFEDRGWKGVLTVRLTSKDIKEAASMGHRAELFENIVLFPRN